MILEQLLGSMMDPQECADGMAHDDFSMNIADEAGELDGGAMALSGSPIKNTVRDRLKRRGVLASPKSSAKKCRTDLGGDAEAAQSQLLESGAAGEAGEALAQAEAEAAEAAQKKGGGGKKQKAPEIAGKKWPKATSGARGASCISLLNVSGSMKASAPRIPML